MPNRELGATENHSLKPHDFAHLNLWLFSACALCGFGVWLSWSVTTVLMLQLGFQHSVSALFSLIAIAGLAGGTLRITLGFLITPGSGRRLLMLTMALLFIPAIGSGLFLRADTPLWILQILALLSGMGGGCFSAFLSAVSDLFSRPRRSTALGFGVGLGHFGIAASQIILPLVVVVNFGGVTGAAITTNAVSTLVGNVMPGSPIWIQQVGLVWPVLLGILLFSIAVAYAIERRATKRLATQLSAMQLSATQVLATQLLETQVRATSSAPINVPPGYATCTSAPANSISVISVPVASVPAASIPTTLAAAPAVRVGLTRIPACVPLVWAVLVGLSTSAMGAWLIFSRETGGSGLQLSRELALAAVVITTLVLLRWIPAGCSGGRAPEFERIYHIFNNRHTWVMSLLGAMSLGSFLGLAAGLPLTLELVFGYASGPDGVRLSNPNAPGIFTYVWMGPLIGMLARPVGGWMAGQFGGARVTHWCALIMMLAAVGAAFYIERAYSAPEPEQYFLPLLMLLLILFAAAGASHASVFFSATKLMPFEQSRYLNFWMAGVAAYGMFYIPHLLGEQLERGTPEQALIGFALFYALCVLLNHWFYLRRDSTFYNP